MKIEDADRLFTKEGFWRQVFPQMLALDLFFTAIPSVIGGVSSPQNAALAGAISLLALGSAHATSYSRARKAHEALKAEFGARYIQLIEHDEVRISPVSILLTSGPASAGRLLSKEV